MDETSKNVPETAHLLHTQNKDALPKSRPVRTPNGPQTGALNQGQVTDVPFFKITSCTLAAYHIDKYYTRNPDSSLGPLGGEIPQNTAGGGCPLRDRLKQIEVTGQSTATDNPAVFWAKIKIKTHSPPDPGRNRPKTNDCVRKM